jgi:hypothetical protein
MKSLFLSLICTVCLSSQAFAESYLTCTNGDISEVGDNLMEVNIYEDGLEINHYESSFGIDPFDAAFSVNADTIYIMDKKVLMSSEGTEFESVIDAMITINDDETEMFMTYSRDKGSFYSFDMTCTRN